MEKQFAFWLGLISRERERLMVFATIVLVSVLGFEAGVIAAHSSPSKPIVIEVPSASLIVGETDTGAVAGMATEQRSDTRSVPEGASTNADCAFVGSKNSTLYHLPTCAPAKRIKPENKVCFKNVAEAEKRGYKPGCLK